MLTLNTQSGSELNQQKDLIRVDQRQQCMGSGAEGTGGEVYYLNRIQLPTPVSKGGFVASSGRGRGQICRVKCIVQAGCKSQARNREGTQSSQTRRRCKVGASIIRLCMAALAQVDKQATSSQKDLPAPEFSIQWWGLQLYILNGLYSENN